MSWFYFRVLDNNNNNKNNDNNNSNWIYIAPFAEHQMSWKDCHLSEIKAVIKKKCLKRDTEA